MLSFHFFALLTFPIFITVAVTAAAGAEESFLPRLRGVSCLLTMNYGSVTCECSFPCCAVLQRLHSSYTPLIFCWEAGLWLLRISCIFLAFLGFWETLNPQDRAAVALRKSAMWLQVTCWDSGNVHWGRPLWDCFYSAFYLKIKDFFSNSFSVFWSHTYLFKMSSLSYVRYNFHLTGISSW